MSIHLREMAHDENMPRGGHLLKDLTGIKLYNSCAVFHIARGGRGRLAYGKTYDLERPVAFGLRNKVELVIASYLFQPHDDATCSGIDLCHELHLVALFIGIFLVDADRICPYDAFKKRVPKTCERCV
ncbi:hypothetical protein K4K49_010041 [Colletotrichum sp. SAR 10_70]|nr:hypothetical protein K4K50_009243 [Colletotrichum sp. SAR 10_71]KAI8194137.1 hypothetical protein K4K49_010041 [Colletotrichum sp. SAR 10_70]